MQVCLREPWRRLRSGYLVSRASKDNWRSTYQSNLLFRSILETQLSCSLNTSRATTRNHNASRLLHPGLEVVQSSLGLLCRSLLLVWYIAFRPRSRGQDDMIIAISLLSARSLHGNRLVGNIKRLCSSLHVFETVAVLLEPRHDGCK